MTTTAVAAPGCPGDHGFVKFDDGRIFCSRCGEFRTVPGLPVAPPVFVPAIQPSFPGASPTTLPYWRLDPTTVVYDMATFASGATRTVTG